ncbi:hypothetical protein CFN78_06845 [Amycolatopsis antarctica]|uniref:Uncharacterized protein n=1 Tax=Amycolatopsis antarctica TaxID=1854586 RepID=A0A263D751_9PSEU|nr:hypothetical protein [Amycolatopsis antarctica]OZM73999.1 hypothetical protein CFN78_06845 [Amycolatopsis antarctica]
MDSPKPTYLPAELACVLDDSIPPEVSGSELYTLRRLAERIYATGYNDGHRSGFDEGLAYMRRPNVNDVNEVRQAIEAKKVAS